MEIVKRGNITRIYHDSNEEYEDLTDEVVEFPYLQIKEKIWSFEDYFDRFVKDRCRDVYDDGYYEDHTYNRETRELSITYQYLDDTYQHRYLTFKGILRIINGRQVLKIKKRIKKYA